MNKISVLSKVLAFFIIVIGIIISIIFENFYGILIALPSFVLFLSIGEIIKLLNSNNIIQQRTHNLLKRNFYKNK